MIEKLTVSVCMITYNHENYIEEAINGVLMQNCDFEIELIIANDASTDKTDEVIQNIIKNHSKASWIKYTRHQQNLGMIPNFIWALRRCKGKYIAICDGDDYWTSPFKLQKQVDFLDRNLDFNIIYTLHSTQYTNNKLIKNEIKPINRREVGVEDIIKDNFIPASSTMFRNVIHGIEFSKWFYSSSYGDWPLYILITKKGEKIKCLLEYTLVYRKNVGIMKEINLSQRNLLENNFKMFSNIYKDENYKEVESIIEYKLYILNTQIMKFLNRNKNFSEAFVKFRIIRKFKLNKSKYSSLPVFKIYIKSFIKSCLD